MNISNNTKFKSTEERIKNAMLRLLQRKSYNDIFVKEICLEAGINRSSFYAHFVDINDLMFKMESEFSSQLAKIFQTAEKFTQETFESMFECLKTNQEFYRAYFKTNEPSWFEKDTFLSFKKPLKIKSASNYGDRELVYHMAFFGGGLKALSKCWILSGCQESPKEMAQIIFDEYKNTLHD